GIVVGFPQAAGEGCQVTGLRRRRRKLSPGWEFLARLGQLYLRSPAVATGIEPMLCPLGSGTGAHVGGKAPAETQRVALAGVQGDLHRYLQILGLAGRRRYLHRIEVAAGQQLPVEFGNERSEEHTS